MIAGPNGSGKSTLMEMLKGAVNTGIYINPDEIEAALVKKPVLHLIDFGFKATQKQFISFIKQETTIGSVAFKKKIISGALIQKNILFINPLLVNSYTASLLADFFRMQLLKNKSSFTFETVMSHPSKLSIIDKAVALKYKTYLYFITTKEPSINIERIKSRTQKGGHNVDYKKTIDRFYRSIKLLPEAIKRCHRAFVFDNTASLTLVAEFKNGKNVNNSRALKKFLSKIK